MEIKYSEGWLPSKEIMKKMEHVAEFVLENEGIDTKQLGKAIIEVSVSFVEADEIKDLNRLHRNIDEVTDVLSFPQYENVEAIKKEVDNLESDDVYDEIQITLGDVVICREKIEEQAKYMGHPVERELLYLFAHSLLHLLDYDHIEKEDYIKMREVENMVMDEVGVGRKKQ